MGEIIDIRDVEINMFTFRCFDEKDKDLFLGKNLGLSTNSSMFLQLLIH